MKKVFTLCMLCAYLVASTGFAFNLHSCGGSLVSVKLASFFKQDKGACACVDKPQSPCCKNSQIIVKIKDSHKGNIQANVVQGLSMMCNIDGGSFLCFFTPHIVSIVETHTQYANAPPFTVLIDTHSFFQVYRI